MTIGRRKFIKTTACAGAATASIEAAPARRPNILFLFPDQLRHDFVEPAALGIPVRTPNIKRLAAEGVRFTEAVTPAPLCAPARACLASGLEYDNCRVPSNQQNYPLDQPTFFQLLRSSGYHVMGCGKFDLHKADLNWGLDGKRLISEWGFSDGVDNEGKHDATTAYVKAGRKPRGPFMAYLERHGLAEAHVEDYEQRKGQGATFVTPLSDVHYGDNWIARNGLALLRAAPRDRPWFLQVNFNGPHPPWDITRAMERPWRGVKFAGPNRANAEFSAAQHDLIRQNYAAMIENIDWRIGELIDQVRQRGELANTLLVVSSDHGEMLGDHGLWGKRHPYHGSTGVPLIFSGLDVRRGALCHDPTTTLDLTATFLDYAGVSRPSHMESRSLRGFVTNKGSLPRDRVWSGMDRWRLVQHGHYKYIRGMGNGPMLFDRRNDPHENDNLASSKPALAAKMNAMLGGDH